MKHVLNEILSSIVAVALVSVGGFYLYHYIIYSTPCAQPISYRVGTFDTRFGIKEEDFLRAVSEAASVWERSSGKDLFVFDQKGKVLVNLIYDKRQEETQTQQKLENQIDQSQALYEQKKKLLDEYTRAYKADAAECEKLRAEFQSKVSGYESQVRYWNKRGGAPTKEYQALRVLQTEIERMQVSLEEKRVALNDRADAINTLVGEVNTLAKQTNNTVSEYNTSDLIGVQFDQGVYVKDGSKIAVNIYQFSDRSKLVRVLEHELGHVLGLDHNGNPDSIMYFLNEGGNERLSADDLAALKTLCNIKE